MNTPEHSPPIPLPLLTMVLATAERLLGATDLHVQVRPTDSDRRTLHVACASAATPDTELIATVQAGATGFDVTFVRSSSPNTTLSAMTWHEPTAGREVATPILKGRESRQSTRRRAADLAFAAFDFRPHAVVDVGPWRFDTSDDTWSRTVVLQDLPFPERVGVDTTFMVRFEHRTATVESVSILARHLTAPGAAW